MERPDLLAKIERELSAATPRPWFARENDLIGGYCVMTVDAPLPEAHTAGIADFVREEDARFIAHAPAFIGAMLPVVRAALAFEEAAMASPVSWSEMSAAELDTLITLLKVVRVFKEAKCDKS